jgi:hypothetical protein
MLALRNILVRRTIPTFKSFQLTSQGPSSGFSILSPRGLAWAQKQTGSSRLADVLGKIKNETEFWPQQHLRRWAQDSSFTRHFLPSHDVAQQLVNREVTTLIYCLQPNCCQIIFNPSMWFFRFSINRCSQLIWIGIIRLIRQRAKHGMLL